MLILHLTRAYRSLSQADSQRAAAECLSPIGRKRSRGAVLSPTPEKRARGEPKQDTSTPSKAQETEETTMVSAKLASNESSSPAAASPSSMLQIGRRYLADFLGAFEPQVMKYQKDVEATAELLRTLNASEKKGKQKSELNKQRKSAARKISETLPYLKQKLRGQAAERIFDAWKLGLPTQEIAAFVRQPCFAAVDLHWPDSGAVPTVQPSPVDCCGCKVFYARQAELKKSYHALDQQQSQQRVDIKTLEDRNEKAHRASTVTWDENVRFRECFAKIRDCIEQTKGKSLPCRFEFALQKIEECMKPAEYLTKRNYDYMAAVADSS